MVKEEKFHNSTLAQETWLPPTSQGTGLPGLPTQTCEASSASGNLEDIIYTKYGHDVD